MAVFLLLPRRKIPLMPKRLKCNLGEQREEMVPSRCSVPPAGLLRFLELASFGSFENQRSKTIPGSLEVPQARLERLEAIWDRERWSNLG